MTDIKKLFIDTLKEIDKNFSPITYDHKNNLDDHIKEVLGCFESYLKDFNKNNNHSVPVKCVVPVFFKILEWNVNKWDYIELDKPYCLLFGRKNSFQNIYSIQSEISKRLNRQFTELVVKNYTGADYLTIISNIDSNLKGSEIEKNTRIIDGIKVIEFSISYNWYNQIKNKYENQSFKENESDTFSTFVLNQYPVTFNSFDENDFINNNESSKIEEILEPSIRDHSFYLDSNHRFYFFFSNIINKKVGDKNKRLGLGGTFLLIHREFWDIEKSYLPILQSISNKISNRIIQHYQIEESLKQTKKAALIQYMSRNLSHNIGSHVIPEAIEYFSEGIVSEKRDEFIYYQKFTQERMELLAHLSSMRKTENLTNYRLEDVIKEISGSIISGGLIDNIKGKVSVKIKVESTIADMSEDQIFVALPEGIIGKQALYLIIENIIRNAYKHSSPNDSPKNKGDYNFKVKVSESKKDEAYWIIDFYDELGSVDLNKRKRDQERLDEIAKHIKNSVLGSQGSANPTGLREKGWGMVEKKAAAAFLVKWPLSELDELPDENFMVHYYDEQGKIIKETAQESEVKNLGYRFYLHKPSLLIIDEEIASVKQKKDKEKLKRKGIIIENIKDANSIRSKPHLFVITNQNLEFTNQKILSANIKTENKSLFEIENELWQNYIKKNHKDIDDYEIIVKNSALRDADKQKILVCFDYHGSNLKFYGQGSSDKTLEYASYKEITKLGLPFYQPYHSKSGLNNYILKKPNISKIKGLILDSVKTNVLVIDERIQKSAQKKDANQKEIKVREILSLIGVEVPEINLKEYLEEPNETITEELLRLIKDTKYKYVILHLTILEKMCGSEDKEILYDYIRSGGGINEPKNFAEEKRAFILVSGRGDPPNLPEKTYYIHYATLYDALIYRMSKPHLLQSLYSLRK